MKIRYLGTGAAEGIPAVFCECRICKNARKIQGKEIRSRSQALIDDSLLIDFGPDTYWHSIRYGIELSRIDYVLITHSHGDHLLYHDLICRKKNRFLEPLNHNAMNVYGSMGVGKELHLLDNGNVTRDGSVVFYCLKPFEEVNIREYKIITLPAIHSSEQPLVYSISNKDKSILYCHDSDILSDESLDYLKNRQIVYDLVSLDCTEGNKEINYTGHMNFSKNIDMRIKMERYGLVNEHTIYITSHFSHNGLVTYEEAKKIALEIGFEVAYDGMEVTL